MAKKPQLEKPPIGTWDPVRFGIDEARDAYRKGKDLPAYLVDALKRYGEARSDRIDQEFILPKLVERASLDGLPKSRNTTKPKTAFQAVAEKLDLTERTVERHYLQAKRKAAAKEK